MMNTRRALTIGFKYGRYRTGFVLLASTLLVVMFFRIQPPNRSGYNSVYTITQNSVHHSSFKKAVIKTASTSGDVILTLVDESYLDMAINFHLLSIKANNITNILYVSLSQKVCSTLRKHLKDLHCYVLKDPADVSNEADVITKLGDLDVEYGSKKFKDKMIIRTMFILEALSTGKNVLLTDMDLVYFQNPLPYFKCEDCDLELMDDCVPSKLVHVYCAGFVYIRPTNMSKKAFHLILEWQIRSNKDDQQLLNHVIQNDMKNEIRFNILDKQKFLCGVQYYEREERFFHKDQECKSCVVVHNNWIVSKAAKVYRFKELHQWVYNDKGYYSNRNRKYITYHNVRLQKLTKTKRAKTIENDYFDENAVNYQTEALKTALELAFVLNRTLILPQFHCETSVCPVNALFHVPTLESTFSGLYREHSFLSHKYVPKAIKEDISLPFRIATDDYECKKHIDQTKMASNTVLLNPGNPEEGMTVQEALLWFKNVPNSVLDIDLVCGVHFSSSQSTDENPEYKQFKERLSKSIVRSTYRQYSTAGPKYLMFSICLMISLTLVGVVLGTVYNFVKKFSRLNIGTA